MSLMCKLRARLVCSAGWDCCNGRDEVAEEGKRHRIRVQRHLAVEEGEQNRVQDCGLCSGSVDQSVKSWRWIERRKRSADDRDASRRVLKISRLTFDIRGLAMHNLPMHESLAMQSIDPSLRLLPSAGSVDLAACFRALATPAFSTARASNLPG